MSDDLGQNLMLLTALVVTLGTLVVFVWQWLRRDRD
ncbi:hypothetical protein FHX49_002445 [Microbacterium endophyticum]|uniref:Uncharacterized protein n=1 Tax=Microbacterium endophyticum TaxID=1526412 RepID=A0A7W4V4U2_9MICO|nr:hypothetical protein [Microbacterium endophyticum]NIK35825.1 hypothetical protein [Microbacterium endophyticum]